MLDFDDAEARGVTEFGSKYAEYTVGAFVGHLHTVNTSTVYDGIRWTFGLKTGEYDSHTPGELGGTLLTFDKENLNVEHVYYGK